MKKIAKLNALPAEDQKRILDLCEKHTYPEITAILAKTRADGGLDLETNRSALSRFYQRHGRLQHNLELTKQFIGVLEASPGTEDLLGHITHLMGLAVFRQMMDLHPFETYRQPLNAYLRLKSLSLRAGKLRLSKSGNRDLAARFFAAEPGIGAEVDPSNLPQPSPHRSETKPGPSKSESARQPATPSSPATSNVPSAPAKSHPSHPKAPVISQISQIGAAPSVPKCIPSLSKSHNCGERQTAESVLAALSSANFAINPQIREMAA